MADDGRVIREKHGYFAQCNSFWRFSTGFYARPGIQELLLKAQEDALDINMILYALWQAGEGRSVSSDDFVRLNEAISDWRKTILIPTRVLRHSLKSRDKEGELYAQAKILELSCEKVQQQIMCEQALQHPKLDISGDAVERIALVNLDLYLEAMNLSLQKPIVTQLAHELRNFIGV